MRLIGVVHGGSKSSEVLGEGGREGGRRNKGDRVRVGQSGAGDCKVLAP